MRWSRLSSWKTFRILVFIILALLPCAAPLPPWQIYTYHDDAFVLLPVYGAPSLCSSVSGPPCPSSLLPDDWHVADCKKIDVTHDDVSEWVLLVWRPWRDWTIQRWHSAPSPVAGFYDAAGDSCHLILLDPVVPSPVSGRHRREIWAGSALPAPLLALAVGDADGDGRNEVVTLEGDYAIGRGGPAAYVDVWRWNGFGFALEWRSPPGVYHELCLTDPNNDGILDIAVR